MQTAAALGQETYLMEYRHARSRHVRHAGCDWDIDALIEATRVPTFNPVLGRITDLLGNIT